MKEPCWYWSPNGQPSNFNYAVTTWLKTLSWIAAIYLAIAVGEAILHGW